MSTNKIKRKNQDVSTDAMKIALGRYLKILRKNWLTAVPYMILPGACVVMVQYVSPLIISKLLSGLSDGSVSTLEQSLPYVLSFGSVYIIGEMLMRVGLHFGHKHERDGLKQLSLEAIEDLMRQDLVFFENNFAGSLVKKAAQFASNYETFIDKVASNLLTIVFTLVFSSIILSQYSLWLVAWLVLITIFAFVGARYFILQRLPIIVERNKLRTKAVGTLSDIVSNIFAVKSSANEKLELKQYRHQINGYLDLSYKSWQFWNWRYDMFISPVYALANMVGLGLALYVGFKNNLGFPIVFLTFTYFARFTRTMWELGPLYNQIEDSISDAAEHVQGIMNTPLVFDKKHAGELKIVGGNIQFKDVTFSYQTKKDKSVLSDLNLSIPAGQSVGLIGPSGGGKTTITKLLLRFMDVRDGSIEIDGQAIDEVTQNSLRRSISYVSQEPMLFHRSIEENIVYARPGATKTAIIDAAKKANAHDFIKSLPDGYDTMVGERGVKLSGGQKQRIAIARAILKDAPIIVFDEATSALDSESEALIQEAIFKLIENRTTIVIAHRLSTIKHLDRILVLEYGKVTEDGTHEELIKQKNGTYAKLWSHQSGGFIE